MQEARVLDELIRTDQQGWYNEADQRHVELLIKGLNLEGEGEKPWKEEENQETLQLSAATGFRALAARANYLVADRPDI